jgi:peptide/nickel transport system permease protein
VTGFGRYVLQRAVIAALLVLLVSSASIILLRLAPGDHLSEIGVDPALRQAERERLCLDCPLLQQYGRWLGHAVRLDLGESAKYRRPVRDLLAERLGNSVLLGASALVAATAIGVPLGIVTGSRRRGGTPVVLRAITTVLLSIPSLIMSLVLLLFAARTGWFPLGGIPPDGAGILESLRHLALPVIALALPVAAHLERIQSRAMEDGLAEPCIAAALARGVPRWRVVWRHALRLSLTPVLGIYGAVIGTLISGSFVVEWVMSWPGLGSLMVEGLRARDAYLVAGCTAAGAMFLALGVFLADIALAAVDPRAPQGAQ